MERKSPNSLARLSGGLSRYLYYCDYFNYKNGNKLVGGINRLTSIISSSAVSSSAISSSALSMLTAPGLPEFGFIAVIGLISLLSFKEVLSESEHWGKALDSSLKMGIVPLLISFSAIIIFKIAEIL